MGFPKAVDILYDPLESVVKDEFEQYVDGSGSDFAKFAAVDILCNGNGD